MAELSFDRKVERVTFDALQVHVFFMTGPPRRHLNYSTIKQVLLPGTIVNSYRFPKAAKTAQ